MINLPRTGLSNNNSNIHHYISNDRKSDSTKDLHEHHVDHQKTYPQRTNRAKLNYRDLERGIYGEIRQLMWTLDGSTLSNKKHVSSWNGDHELIDLSIDDDDDDDDDMKDLCCICKNPRGYTRLMLQCYSCAQWYHNNCIGLTKEQARAIEINPKPFICSSCRGTSNSMNKSTTLSDENITLKRKYSDHLSSENSSEIQEKRTLTESFSYDESMKISKPDIPSSPQTSCIVHDCKNQSRSDGIYCSPACIRRHINDTLQAIQESKGVDNEDIPTREDILLYESRNKKYLEKHLVPKIEDLCIWINQHPSYQILKSSSRPSISSSSSSVEKRSKIKLLSLPITSYQRTHTKSIRTKKKPKQVSRELNDTTADIRSKVSTALYDKILMRLERNGEKHLINENIRAKVERIEQEMFRIHGKVDKSYKNKFRALLANINNMNNNFFYKQILSKELTAKEIVAMKPEDMLPPEEKEKRKDQFEKEVQKIMDAEQQTAEEMERRKRMKLTRQGLVDNDPILPMFKLKEQSSSEEKMDQQIINTFEKSSDTKQSTNNSITKLEPKICLVTNVSKRDSPKSVKPVLLAPTDDSDDDHIEPESPTGIDALIYDDDDDENDSNYINTSSHAPIVEPTNENVEYNISYPPIIRDDYNPSKFQNTKPSFDQPTPILHLPNQWRGIIHPSDIKMPCQSVHVYGEGDYLIGNIPEELTILGRLRLSDLWDYIHESLAVRDVLILTLTSSSRHTHDNDIFLQYVKTMQTSGRAAVISKCTNTSLIRDMYILAADTKDCPASVLSLLFLPVTVEIKQLFLVIIGSGKRTIKSIPRSNENQSLNDSIYKPIALQASIVTRDPRLLKNRDPRLIRNNPTNESIIKLNNNKSSNEDLLKLISDTLERIRHSPTTDNIHSITISTTEILKSNGREDLCRRFTDELHLIMSKCQITQGNISISTSAMITDVNLIEENMDVDDDQDDKHKEQLVTSSTSKISDEFNDTDDRFLAQDMDHPMPQKPRRKSRFSDILPPDHHRSVKLKSNISTDKPSFINTGHVKKPSGKSIHNHINPSISSKFESITPSKPICFSLSKDSFQQVKLNMSSTKINKKDVDDLTLFTDNQTKSTLPITSIHSLIMQQQKAKNRYSSNTYDWRLSNNDSYYMRHYHDLDQPEE